MKTQITIESILATPTPGLFAVVLVAGQPQVRVVDLGPGLSFDPQTAALTVTAVPPAPVQAKYDVLATRQEDGSWLLPDVPTGALQVRLNGLHMLPGQNMDYTISGAVITFTTGQSASLNPASVVSASYQL